MKKEAERKITVDVEKRGEALSFILENYFKAGFGSLSKSDVDLIFFTAVIRFGEHKDDSDYYYSKLLGITQQRVRNFKEKSYLKFGTSEKKQDSELHIWKILSKKIEYATYDKKTAKITIPIYDVNMFREIEHIVERDLKTVVDIQLNPKIFRISLSEFFDLILLKEKDIHDDKLKRDEFINMQISKIKKKLKDENKDQLVAKIEQQSMHDKFGNSFLINIAADLSLDLLKDIIPGGNISVNIIKKVIDLINK